jgi:hypothetical protein
MEGSLDMWSPPQKLTTGQVKVIDVPPEGNCLFYILVGDQNMEQVTEMRSTLMEGLRAMKDTQHDWMDDSFTWGEVGLHAAMNARLEVSHCHAIYLWMSMIFFTSLTGVNITPKRNMVSETKSNMFIVMHSNVCNPCYCTSELAEHGFGSTWRSQREFTCSDFASHVDKQN